MMRTFARTVTVVALTAFAGLSAAGGAMGAEDPAPPTVSGQPSVQQLQRARESADTPEARAVLGDLLAQFGAQTPQATPNVETNPVPVYTVTKHFVQGQDGGTVAALAHVAVPVHTPDGKAVTLFSQRGADGSWSARRASTGDVEAQLATRLPAGAKLLHEPQINAWYALTGDSVELLDGGVGQQQVGDVIPLADYQRQVHAAYGDKLPGSEYDQKGAGGGYNHAAPVTEGISWAPFTVGGGVLVAGFVLWYGRRRATR